MANRLLKCSLCGQILGTYPKYCPYCGGAPMTTDANPRIVEVPYTKPSARTPVSGSRSTGNWWEPQTSPNSRATSGATFVPPPQGGAVKPTVKPPDEKAEKRKPPEVKREKTKEERFIDRLSAASTAVVFAVVAVCVWNYYHAHEDQISGRIFDLWNEAVNEITKLPDGTPIDDEVELSFADTLDIGSAAPIENYTTEYGSFEINTDIWQPDEIKYDRAGGIFTFIYKGNDQPSGTVLEIIISGSKPNKHVLPEKEKYEHLSSELVDLGFDFDALNEYTEYDNARAVYADGDNEGLIDNSSDTSWLLIFEGYTEVQIFCDGYAGNTDVFEGELINVISSIRLFNIERTDTE